MKTNESLCILCVMCDTDSFCLYYKEGNLIYSLKLYTVNIIRNYSNFIKSNSLTKYTNT